jgi:murein DD-endopeptidase MepM/ murein hydrolase activator NlpD
MKYVNKITNIFLIIILSTISLNSKITESKDIVNFDMEIYEKSITTSAPIFSPIPLEALKKDLFKCSGLGYRIHPMFFVNKFHKGLDMPAAEGTPVYATSHGEVMFAGNKGNGYGNQIDIRSGDYDSKFAHLSYIEPSVVSKDGLPVKVSFGQLIGKVGSTGQSSGPHLHYEIYYKKIVQNPVIYITGDVFKIR